MIPLEVAISNEYITALLGRPVSNMERDMLALPASFGGAAIDNPSLESSHKHVASKTVTASLVSLIKQQISTAEPPATHETKKEIKKLNNDRHKLELQNLQQNLPIDQARSLDLAQQKGAAALITTKPLELYGLHLAKNDFRDAILLRYGWPITELPSSCVCGKPFTVDHSQVCRVGGFVHMRHDNVRDLIAGHMKEVFNDVEVEPPLTPLSGENLVPRSANTSDEARADIRVNGFWSRQQSAFFDVRIFYPQAPTYRDRSLSELLARFEADKKRQYSDRIVQVERGTFTPLVFSSGGVMGKETSFAIKKVATALSIKRGESYSAVTGLLRC